MAPGVVVVGAGAVAVAAPPGDLLHPVHQAVGLPHLIQPAPGGEYYNIRSYQPEGFR